MGKIDRFYYFLIAVISILFLSDILISGSLPGTMDGLIHTVSIAQFGDALLQHTFPIIWLNNFANYGLPVGLFSHQLPIYLGALLDLVFKNPVLSTNSISLLGVMLANLLFYKFLRIYFLPRVSFFATLLFALAPYRILNAYIRGATPETFSLFFLPLILINLHGLIVKRRIHSFFFLTLSCTGLALTHPMMLVIYSFFIIPYLIFLLFSQKDKAGKSALAAFVIPTFASLLAALLSLGIAGYYYLPLFLEKKYFYFGMSTNLLNESFLGLQNFIGTKWYYFYGNDIFTRGHVLQVGFLESMLLVVGVVLLIKEFFQKKKSESYYLLLVTSFVGVAVVVLLLPFSRPIYGFLSILQSIQFPWRMLSVFVVVPPLIFACIVQRHKNMWPLFVLVVIVVMSRIPQLYGKNYTSYPASFFHSTKDNLHSINMNTIWTGKTEDYPVRKKQVEIIEGNGIISNTILKNTQRQFLVQATTPLRIVDYTFYFPGWEVEIDGKQVPIEFQDEHFRGVIIYRIPVGEHKVDMIFADTRVRKVAKLISVVSIVFLLVLFILRKKVLSKLGYYAKYY